MSAFKDCLARDLDTVFHNTAEFATCTEIRYDGESYTVNAVIDTCEEAARKQDADDYAQGLFVADVTVYIKFSELGFVPRKNHNITLANDDYKIVKSEEQNGEIILRLEMIDE